MSLDTIKSTLFKFVGNKQAMLIFFLVLLFVLMALYIFKRYITPKINPSYKANSEFIPENNDHSGSGGGEDNTATVYYFYTTWCPHCIAASETMALFKNKYDGQQFKGYTITYQAIDCTETKDNSATTALIAKYGVQGYPTIKLVKNGGEAIDYNAKPSTDHLDQFMASML